jgi:hypothetical protein
MPQGATLRVEGYRELLRALQTADREQKREVRQTLRKVGSIVQADATRRLSSKSAHSAAGFKTRVRQGGVAVEQALRKTTGVHPEWGSYQMRHALLPALMSNEDETVRAMEQAMDEMAAHFNSGGIG